MNRTLLRTLLTLALALSLSPLLHAQKPTVTHTATMVTSQGTMEIELYGTDAPKTVANFVGLAQRKFFEGIIFHRVVPNFVIQAGDPKTKDPNLRAEWGTGGESIYSTFTFEDEINPASPSRQRGYVMGVLAMANSGPNTNQSQFFIVTSNEGAKHLANYNTYTIFGMVSLGLDVVKKIESTPAGTVKILSVTVNGAGGAAVSGGGTQRTPRNETAQQFWKRFQTAVKKGRKSEVADAFLFTSAMEFWGQCESGRPPITRENFLDCYTKIFPSYARNAIAKARLQHENIVECSEGYRGEGYTVRFLSAKTTRDRRGQVYRSESLYTIAQISGEWKIICAATIGQND